MGRDTTCDRCGEWIYFVTCDGRPIPMQDGRRHRCVSESSIASPTAVVRPTRPVSQVQIERRLEREASVNSNRISQDTVGGTSLLSLLIFIVLIAVIVKTLGYLFS